MLQGLEENTFEEALKNEKERVTQKGIWKEIQPYNYTGRGFYYSQINSFNYFLEEEYFAYKIRIVILANR